MARYTAEEVQKLLHIINRLQDQYDIRKEGNIYSTFQKKINMSFRFDRID